jgi:hypothetical protein
MSIGSSNLNELFTQDVSSEFRELLKVYLQEHGYDYVARTL